MTPSPLTPPPELVQQWASMSPKNDAVQQNWIEIATQAAQWGADTELEACCLWMERNFDDWDNRFSDDLRRHRRPKPPSLKELALAKTDSILNDPRRALLIEVREALELNRRALEALDD
jgi:hypothetical protein